MFSSELRDIPGFPNYAVTRDGRVWSKPRRWHYRSGIRKGCWIKPSIRKSGHLRVNLNKSDHEYIHRLVLKTYVGECPEGMECRHLDGTPGNNLLSNLKWGTHKENQQDSIKQGTHSSLRQGVRNNRTKLKESDVKVIRHLREEAKFTYKQIAWHFDLTWSAIWRICKRKSWSCIT